MSDRLIEKMLVSIFIKKEFLKYKLNQFTFKFIVQLGGIYILLFIMLVITLYAPQKLI